MTNSTPDLLPCPFCGGKAIDIYMQEIPFGIMNKPMPWWHLKCLCGHGAAFSSKDGLIEKWNTRAAPAADAAVDWEGMQRYIEEGADEPDWDASWVIDRVKTCIRAHLTAMSAVDAGDERLKKQIEYSSYLQQIIEALCHGHSIPEPKTTARYHYDMAVEARAHLESVRGKG